MTVMSSREVARIGALLLMAHNDGQFAAGKTTQADDNARLARSIGRPPSILETHPDELREFLGDHKERPRARD